MKSLVYYSRRSSCNLTHGNSSLIRTAGCTCCTSLAIYQRPGQPSRYGNQQHLQYCQHHRQFSSSILQIGAQSGMNDINICTYCWPQQIMSPAFILSIIPSIQLLTGLKTASLFLLSGLRSEDVWAGAVRERKTNRGTITWGCIAGVVSPLASYAGLWWQVKNVF